jgi:hypothetical protein
MMFLTQDAAAQFMEKKVLTLAAARKMVAAAEVEAERHHLAGVRGGRRRRWLAHSN